MIPQWLARKRHDVCVRCPQAKNCADKITMLNDNPRCPLDKLPPLSDELTWAKAWPEHAPLISGCCDPIGASH